MPRKVKDNIAADDLNVLKKAKKIKKKKPRKPTRAQIERRLREIEVLLNAGYSRLSIVQYSAKSFKIKARQADKYIREIKDRWAAELDSDIRIHLASSLKRRELLFEKAYKKEDYRTANHIQKDIDKLTGIDKKNPLDQGGAVADLGLDDINKILDEYEKGSKKEASK